MRRRRRGGATARRSIVAAFVIMLVPAFAATAAAGNAGSTEVFTEQIAETLPAGMCPDLPAGLSVDFTGTARGHFHLSTDANGVLHVSGNVAVTGTALDSVGATYRFDYHQTFHLQVTDFPFVVTITDHFNLVGQGAANQIHTFFVLKLLITEDGEEVVFLVEHGDPANCDPI